VTAEHGTLTAAEAYRFHRDLVEGPQASEVDSRVAARILGGKRMTAHDLLAIQAARQSLRQALLGELDGALLATPTLPHVAPETAPLEADPERFNAANLKTLRNTMLGNFLALCGLALPSGHDGRGLPTSILISGPGGADARLLGVGLAIEALSTD
jgi:aspartyl-tRNA(Asn)/glutamyl-tRNA(Gln) amidotransferase subunit A